MKIKRNLKKVKQTLKTKKHNNLPPLRFWTAWITNGHDQAIYIGMTQANNPNFARQRILKEWRYQPHVVEDIMKGKVKLFVRPMKVVKNGSSN